MSDEQFLSSEETPGSVATTISVPGDASTTERRPKEVPVPRFRMPKAPWRGVESGMVSEEVAGRSPAVAPIDVGPEAGPEDHTEVRYEAESGEEPDDAEATAEPTPQEDAFSDLRTVEGFELPAPRHEFAGEAAETALPDAGSALGQQEFLPALAGIASTVIPILASKAGPIVAKKVAKRLSPRARRIIGRHAKTGLGVLATAAKLFETAEEAPVPSGNGAEAGTLADEATIQEITQAMEVIIGTDDRVRITATTQVPWRRYCALRITMPSGAVYRGTGFFIGPRAIATAGHCVYVRSQGGWARRIEVIPGSNGTTRPFGQVVASSFRSVSGWTVQQRPEADYGCIILPQGSFGGSIGHFGFAVVAAPALQASNAVLAGYPGDKPFAQLWGMGRRIKLVTPTQLIYDIDTMGGQSGAPVYIMRNGCRYVVGIHNYGAATGNSATRITASVYQNLKNWAAI